MGIETNVLIFSGQKAADSFRVLQPVEEEKGSISRVTIIDFLEHFSARPRPLLMCEYEEMLAKLCFLTKDSLIITVPGVQSLPRERNGWGELPYLSDGTTKVTSLRLRRLLEDYEFKVVEMVVQGSHLKVKAKRMKRILYGTYADRPFYEVAKLDEIVEAAIGCRDSFFEQLERSTRVKTWKKWPKINWMKNDFRPWLFNPVMFCGRCQLFKGGIHRTAVAKALGNPTLAVRIMKCWWEGERSCWRKEIRDESR